MMGGQGGIGGSVETLAGVEQDLAATLSATSEEIAHSECLDAEARAEVYTILEAIQADSQVHQEAIRKLIPQLAEAGDA